MTAQKTFNEDRKGRETHEKRVKNAESVHMRDRVHNIHRPAAAHQRQERAKSECEQRWLAMQQFKRHPCILTLIKPDWLTWAYVHTYVRMYICMYIQTHFNWFLIILNALSMTRVMLPAESSERSGGSAGLDSQRCSSSAYPFLLQLKVHSCLPQVLVLCCYFTEPLGQLWLCPS